MGTNPDEASMNHHEPDKQLEQLVHHGLQALPELSAPAELIPNVLRTIAARGPKNWWRHPWPEWPRAMRILSGALLAGLLGALRIFSGDLEVVSARLAGS